MKRIRKAKLRDRKSGQSSYQRQGKVPYRYSAGYYDWFRSVTKRVAKSAEETRT